MILPSLVKENPLCTEQAPVAADLSNIKWTSATGTIIFLQKKATKPSTTYCGFLVWSPEDLLNLFGKNSQLRYFIFNLM